MQLTSRTDEKMETSIPDLLKQALEADVFQPTIDKSQSIARHKSEGTPESNPRNRVQFAAAIQPTAEALHALLDSGLHGEAIRTVVAATCIIAVQLDQIRHDGEGDAAKMFAPSGSQLPLATMSLQFALEESSPVAAEVVLVVPKWGLATFDTRGHIQSTLGFPGATDFLARNVKLLDRYIQHIVQAAK